MSDFREPLHVSRRSLLKASGVAVATVAATATYVRDAAAVRKGGFFNPVLLAPVPVYYLSPDCASTQCADQTEIRHSCNSCKACRRHAINKRWASESAIRRAHPCCRCTVKKTLVPRALYQEMFGTGAQARTEFDLRSLRR